MLDDAMVGYADADPELCDFPAERGDLVDR